MNRRIKELVEQSSGETYWSNTQNRYVRDFDKELFAKLLVSEVLDEVEERAYYCGDRAWSDDLDRPWIELEFGFGNLAEL